MKGQTKSSRLYLAMLTVCSMATDLQCGHSHVGARSLLPADMSRVQRNVHKWSSYPRGDWHGRQGLGSRSHAVSYQATIISCVGKFLWCAFYDREYYEDWMVVSDFYVRILELILFLSNS